MSDKPLVQQRLATDLSSLILSIDPVNASTSSSGFDPKTSASLDFIAGFWEALVREWTGIDRLRMDKYYMLIRRWQNATFRMLARDGWSEEAMRRYNGILLATIGGPLS
jgi:ribosomal RNA-processing protein 1